MKKIILGALALSVGMAYAQAPLDYIASYPLGADANDESANENHGTITGDVAAAEDRFGNPQGAYYFDGNGDYITLANAASFEVAEYTYSAWIKPEDMASANVVLGIGGSGGDQVLAYGTNGAYLSSYTKNQQNTVSVNSGGQDLNNEWHHILAIRTATSAEIYVDGILMESKTPDFTTVAYGFSSWATIGRSHRTVSDAFKGAIDDVLIYDRALTSIEIAELCPKTCAYKEDNLIARYLFSNDVTDSYVNGLDVTMSGDPQFVADRFGNANSAIDMDGNGDYVSTTNSLFHLSEYSYSLWIKPTEQSGTVLAVGNSGGDQTVVYSSTSFGSASYTKNQQNISNAHAGTMDLNAEWHHVVVLRADTIHKLYLDGVLIAENTPDFTTVAYGSSDLFLLGKSHRNNDHFNGVIDDVLIYDVVLTEEEIIDLYTMECSAENQVITSIETSQEELSSIYPNPASESLTINGDWDNYTILDMTGSAVDSGDLISNVVGVTDLESGMYIIELMKDENLKVQRVIIK